jgi:anti-sigma B factor antagonist
MGEGVGMNLDLTASTTGARTVLEVRGEVDLQSAAQLADRLSQIIGSGQQSVVLDLSGLSFIDSTGLGALVAARNQARQAGVALRLACCSERTLKLFRITGLDAVFDIYPTLPQAIGAG